MNRTWMLALPAALALAFAACGGGGGQASPASPSATTDPNAPATPAPGSENLGQPTADTGIPSASPAADGDIALSVVFGDKTYTPTVAEFRQLPTVEITVAGTKQTGVSLAALAEKVGAPAGSVTVQGRQPNLARLAFIRYPLADVGSTTVLALNGQGQVDLFSSSIPAAQWLKVVEGVSFQQ